MLTKEQKDKLRAVYAADVWPNSERMTDFCTNKAAALAELPNGDMIPVEKQKIETDFCFGESGYDYDDAVSAAANARKNESYFKRENMKHFNGWIDDLAEQEEMHGADPSLPRFVMLIAEKPYYGQPEASKLKGLTFCRDGDVLDALGGSAFVWEMPGQRVTVRGQNYRIPTHSELDAIRAAYEQAREEHGKKVERYLQRYGLTKVHAWTYWRDA